MDIQYKFTNELTDDERDIRREVFVDEQGVPEEAEFDERDNNSVHIVIYSDNSAVACCRFFKTENGEYCIGRVAARESARGCGFGGMLMDAAEDMIRADGGEIIFVHAQVRVKGFYKKYGYKETGEPFFEDGIKHILMRKNITMQTFAETLM